MAPKRKKHGISHLKQYHDVVDRSFLSPSQPHIRNNR